MMKKEKSPETSKMKLLLILPIVALLVFAFAKKEYVIVNVENIKSSSTVSFEQIETQEDLIKLNGNVVNSDGNPLTGANVILKGTNNGTVVDRQGEFVLEVPKTDKPFTRTAREGGKVTVPNAQTIVISFVGYGTHEYVFNTQNNQEVNEVKIILHKASFNVTLPEIGSDEKGAIVEFSTPEISDDEELSKGEIIEVPASNSPRIEGKNEEIFTIVEELPGYKNGGMYQLAIDLRKEVEWVMKKTKDRGNAVVGFTVSANGNIDNPRIVQSANIKMLDASAVKIITKLDNWKPGVQRGKKVPVDLTVPVKFE